jgi:hypothetical protein
MAATKNVSPRLKHNKTVAVGSAEFIPPAAGNSFPALDRRFNYNATSARNRGMNSGLQAE